MEMLEKCLGAFYSHLTDTWLMFTLFHRAFEAILNTDRAMYGDSTSYSLPTGESDTFQNAVDLVITA